jgi:hypothetical protein
VLKSWGNIARVRDTCNSCAILAETILQHEGFCWSVLGSVGVFDTTAQVNNLSTLQIGQFRRDINVIIIVSMWKSELSQSIQIGEDESNRCLQITDTM